MNQLIFHRGIVPLHVSYWCLTRIFEFIMYTFLTAALILAQPPDLPKDTEKLPTAPKTTEKAEHKALNPEKSLFLETAPDKEGKQKPIRVLFAAEVCLSKGPLEVFCTKRGTKEHEAIVRIDTPQEAEYYRSGGILPYVLQQLAAR